LDLKVVRIISFAENVILFAFEDSEKSSSHL